MYRVAHHYVLRHFEEIARLSEQLIQMPVDELHAILNDDLLNVKDECLVWECILRWIEYDRDTRHLHMAKLLSAIRLGCLNATVSLYTKTNIGRQQISYTIRTVLHGQHHQSQVCSEQCRMQTNHSGSSEFSARSK